MHVLQKAEKLRWLLIATALTAPVQSQSVDSRQAQLTHGTVNIFLASGSTLVAVTDSMLTFANHAHEETGVKLYKLDDRTICAIAGLYSDPGPAGLDELALAMPEAIDTLSRAESSPQSARMPFPERVSRIGTMFSGQLTTHLQAMVTSNPALNIGDPSFLVELTVAGYDDDGGLNAADLTFAPRRTGWGVTFGSIARPRSAAIPICALTANVRIVRPRPGEEDSDPTFSLNKVRDTLFCDVAGKTAIAEELLDHPDELPQDQILQMYLRDLQADKTPSPAQMRDLAIDLERQTAANERREGTFEVGGPIQVAVLSGGKVVESPPEAPPQDEGRPKVITHISGMNFRCASGGGGMITPSIFPQPSVSMTGCTQDIDELGFHDSTFTDSRLIYLGPTPILFADNNVIANTSLELGSSVDLKRADVIHLVCGFPWKAVSQDSKEVKMECPPAGH
jgi:hypothetical protein